MFRRVRENKNGGSVIININKMSDESIVTNPADINAVDFRVVNTDVCTRDEIKQLILGTNDDVTLFLMSKTSEGVMKILNWLNKI